MKTISVRIPEEIYLVLKELSVPASQVIREGIRMYLEQHYGKERFLQLLEEMKEKAIEIELKEALEYVKTHAANKDEAKALFKQKVEEISKRLKVPEEAIRKVYEKLKGK